MNHSSSLRLEFMVPRLMHLVIRDSAHKVLVEIPCKSMLDKVTFINPSLHLMLALSDNLVAAADILWACVDGANDWLKK